MTSASWSDLPLKKVIKLKRGFDLATNKRAPGIFPVVGAAGISGWHSEGPIKGPGVVLGRAGASMGVATYVTQDFWPLNTSLFVEDFLGNNPRFIYSMLRCIDFSGYNSGAAQPMLNRNYIRSVTVTVPPISEQDKIASLLGALDDKIAVNERIADSSRQLALSLFEKDTLRSGRTTTVSAISSLLTRGGTPKYTDDDQQLTVVNQKCVRGGRVDLSPSRKTLREKVRPERVLQSGDVLVNSTGVGTLGRVSLWTHDVEATCDTHVTIVRINEAVIPQIIGALALLRSQSEIERLGEGSTGQTELSRAKLGSFSLQVPEEMSWPRLADDIQALERSGDHALRENHTLAALRDTLLPKLISGELRIKDAEREGSDAV
ncbi:type I restriction enzyme S subunit [Spinactinospora alkalitolerans]|uniref:Type I restriction enzyme S subunit n=1 Tax=Spinactinospora alkalitolerans TaxID=687207 RepID=A0A852TY45_9ACTN|nr:restriction endonuclease subunit S [Spinactinospora alkalitolerans]NYE48858.1 type I restriction enzyme S subunit [Spinactinospora alkalitolerans]